MSICAPHHLPIRKTPAHEGREVPKYTEHIFVTCCTRSKINALDNHDVHALLVSLWMDTSHWIVTRYVIMPDHVHGICISELHHYSSRLGDMVEGTGHQKTRVHSWHSMAARPVGYTNAQPRTLGRKDGLYERESRSCGTCDDYDFLAVSRRPSRLRAAHFEHTSSSRNES